MLCCLPAIVIDLQCHANRIDVDGGGGILSDHLVEPPGITF